MSSVRRWVLTLVELETAVHDVSFQFQLERFSLRGRGNDFFVLV